MYCSTVLTCSWPRCRTKVVHASIILSLWGMLCHSSAHAQPSDSSSEINGLARTQILTRPSGAVVHLKGEYSLVGMAPYTVGHYIKGPYRIKAKLRGYEDWAGKFAFSGEGKEKLSVKLNAKTRVKTLWRSTLVTGWGQCYADQKVKGGLLFFGQLTAAGILVAEHVRYHQAVDDLTAVNRQYLLSQSDPDARSVLQSQLLQTQQRVNDRFDSRQRWAVIAASIYFYNLIDALVFFPSYDLGRGDLKLAMEISSDAGAGVTKVGVRAQF